MINSINKKLDTTRITKKNGTEKIMNVFNYPLLVRTYTKKDLKARMIRTLILTVMSSWLYQLSYNLCLSK